MGRKWREVEKYGREVVISINQVFSKKEFWGTSQEWRTIMRDRNLTYHPLLLSSGRDFPSSFSFHQEESQCVCFILDYFLKTVANDGQWVTPMWLLAELAGFELSWAWTLVWWYRFCPTPLGVSKCLFVMSVVPSSKANSFYKDFFFF